MGKRSGLLCVKIYFPGPSSIKSMRQFKDNKTQKQAPAKLQYFIVYIYTSVQSEFFDNIVKRKIIHLL